MVIGLAVVVRPAATDHALVALVLPLVTDTSAAANGSPAGVRSGFAGGGSPASRTSKYANAPFPSCDCSYSPSVPSGNEYPGAIEEALKLNSVVVAAPFGVTLTVMLPGV